MSAVLFFDERSVQELMPDPARARDLVPVCLTAYARGTHLGTLAASPPTSERWSADRSVRGARLNRLAQSPRQGHPPRDQHDHT